MIFLWELTYILTYILTYMRDLLVRFTRVVCPHHQETDKARPPPQSGLAVAWPLTR